MAIQHQAIVSLPGSMVLQANVLLNVLNTVGIATQARYYSCISHVPAL